MTKTDAQQAIEQTAPTTKAAQLRDVMPEIEAKLAGVVRRPSGEYDIEKLRGAAGEGRYELGQLQRAHDEPTA